MAQGRKTGGRQKGTRNKASAAQREQAAASGMLPHEFLLAVVRGERIQLSAEGDGEFHVPSFAERLEAARAVAPYFAPKLAAVEHSGPDGEAVDHSITVTFVRPNAAS